MQTATSHQDDVKNESEVPVTGTFLSLVKALHSARTMYISESSMAEDLGMTKPVDWQARCHNLFYGKYAQQIEAIGLQFNEITFQALMSLNVPDEAWRTDFAVLPTKFVFDPWLGQGRGGIRVIG